MLQITLAGRSVASRLPISATPDLLPIIELERNNGIIIIFMSVSNGVVSRPTPLRLRRVWVRHYWSQLAYRPDSVTECPLQKTCHPIARLLVRSDGRQDTVGVFYPAGFNIIE